MGKQTLNIYLNKEQRKKCDDLKQKYQLSLTTIVDILCFITFKYVYQEQNKQNLENLRTQYLYPKGAKTSIKLPKIMKEKEFFQNEKYKSRFATNVLLIYLNKTIWQYLDDPKKAKQYYNEINNKFTTTKDDWWGYNQHIRYERRSLRQNKEYYKHELEKLDHVKSN